MEKHFHHKDEAPKMTNEQVVSIVDNDFILNFLNEYDHHPNKNSFYANPNLAASFNNFYEAFPLEQQPLHFMGYPGRNTELMNENERFQLPHCKMEQIDHEQTQVNEKPEKKVPKKNYKKKNNNKTNNPKKNNENFSPVNLMQIKEINENEELFNYRNNIKNTYINKISNLITNNVEENHYLSKKSKIKSEDDDDSDNELDAKHLENSAMQSKRSHKINDNKRCDELDRLNKKLEKNRESARNSRKRKKIYIELLENKVAELTHQLETANKSLDFNEQQLTKISSHSKFLNNLIQIKQQIYGKLDKLAVQPANQVENEMNLLIDSLRLRLGATGKERVTAINSLFKQIIQILVPGYVRFLLGISAEPMDKGDEGNEKILIRKSSNMSEHSIDVSCLNADFVNEEQQRRLFAELGLNDAQKKSFKKFKKKLNTENLKLKTFLENILSMKKNMQKQTMNIDNAVDELRNSFSPLQITKFLLFVEKEKKSMKMNLTKLIIPTDSSYDDSESNNSDFSDVNKETNKQETNIKEPPEGSCNNSEKQNIDNSQKTRKKVHLNEELVSPL